MDWAVLAAPAAVIVTAVLGALGIAREQSAMRQLERVTAVLKDGGDDFDGRAELLWLRAALAARVNRQYRAPRRPGALLFGWAMSLAGLGVLLWVYLVLSSAFFRIVTTDDIGQPRVGATWALLIALTFLGAAGWVVGALHLRRRKRDRAKWSATAEPDDSDAPKL